MVAINNVNNVSNANPTGSLESSNKSIQMQFAELQMTLAQDRKADAANIIKNIKEKQNLSKRYAELIKNLRGAYTNPKDGSSENKARKAAIQQYKSEFMALGGSGNYFDTKDKEFTPTVLDKMVNDLQTLQDTVGSDIQQQMIYVQDYIGQYNAYMQGANTAINNANQTLTSLARGN